VFADDVVVFADQVAVFADGVAVFATRANNRYLHMLKIIRINGSLTSS
jgi:hypothetical protein